MDESQQKIPPADGSGKFIPTLNKMGYMTTGLDPISQEFVDFSKGRHTSEYQPSVLDIGAAYGIASIPLIKSNVKVYANDIDPRHLDLLENELTNEEKQFLVKSPGSFPDKLNFPENSFDAILICRVLHFFDGETIERSLNAIYRWLKPEGKVFIVTETPFLKNWQSYLPEYENKKQNDDLWPGLISDTVKYEQHHTKRLPPLVNWLDKDVLGRELTKANLHCELVTYLNREDFPDELRLDGRESVAAIACKK